jgi:uncharacterized membrane-anchored protein
MQRKNLPILNGRYWAAILAASLIGTTLGDFVSQTLKLGYFKGLVPLGILLAIIFLAERKAKRPSEVYYWLAIVITRTGATNIADLATHQLKLNYVGVASCLLTLLLITLLAGRPRTLSDNSAQQDLNEKKTLPNANLRYWTAILIASVLGTTLGDFVSEGLGFGVEKGSIILGVILALVLYAQSRAKRASKTWYWVTIVTARTAGTIMGDCLSGGFHFGFLWSAVGAAVLLTSILIFWPE